ncbi:MAG: acyltransferase [Dechloromonas sp.]|uniref:Acyltransferase n=1 Tax=Candidatus Dechloromonas phosphorivorans TaxID=2899244 RepID=A0A9D7LYG4_9RHOO|nr:acyltransferase [Candidatus Dechloromonas phosphorivorans]
MRLSRLLVKVLDRISHLYWQIKYAEFRKKYSIDRSFRFNGRMILFYGEGSISIKESSYIGELSTMQAVRGFSISIGTACSISHNVRIYTQSNVPDYDYSRPSIPEKRGDVVIGNYSWIGANVFIGPGVTIGENAIVGANSVVTRNVPPFEIWGGVPAKLIKKKELI